MKAQNQSGQSLDLTLTHFDLLHEFFEHTTDRHPEKIALICDDKSFTYQELENRSNQLAHYLKDQGIEAGHYVGIYLSRTEEVYVAILAVLKAGAAYLPFDPEFPLERVIYSLQDSGAKAVISYSQMISDSVTDICKLLVLDQLHAAIQLQPMTRLKKTTTTTDDDAYAIYTSGSTGKPKGVAVRHSNVCHYVRSAVTIYQVTSADQIYQGFSIAFDASIEEIWLAFATGATLVAGTSKELRSGAGLLEFLQQHKVSVFSCVPTLLSMMEGELPDLRLLIFGGEVCSPALIQRWSRPGLRIVNTYGPTEATVIATYAECVVGKAITIGRPLPGYEIFILNENLQAVKEGEVGEICIGGPGLARGYINQPQLTAQKFIFYSGHMAQRLYRTGDRGYMTEEGDLQFIGRVDDQIKLRGYRIELNEIEAVLLEFPGIRHGVVSVCELTPTVSSLIAYLVPEKNMDIDNKKLMKFLQSRLPEYMQPTVFEFIMELPILSSGKVDRKRLPAPTSNGYQSKKTYIAAHSEAEKKIVTVWQDLFKQAPISIKDDFFHDLGGHSLLAARAVSTLRKDAQFQHISMLDIYKNSTAEKLAKLFNVVDVPNTAANDYKHQTKEDEAVINTRYRHSCIMQALGCAAQFAVKSWEFLLMFGVLTFMIDKYSLFSIEFLQALILLLIGMPPLLFAISILSKWLILGRVKPGRHRLWGAYYVRWWFAQRMIALATPRYLAGSPLMTLYCRLMGAKVGKNCYIGSEFISTFDLLNIGDNTSISPGAMILGYTIEDGWLKIGSVNIGDHCLVGTKSVLEINTEMQDYSVLEDQSMLRANTRIPRGECYFGSPARQSLKSIDLMNVKPINNHYLKNLGYGIMHYFALFFVECVCLFTYLPGLLLICYFYDQGNLLLAILLGAPLGALLSIVLLWSSIIVVKKWLLGTIKPGTYLVQSFFYVRKWIVGQLLDRPEVAGLADTLFYPLLYRFLGAKIGKRVEMTDAPHIMPDFVDMGDESYTTGAAHLAVPRVYEGYITFAPVKIGRRAFVGNLSVMSCGSELGDSCLLGSLSIPPKNNDSAKPNTSWFGSPAVLMPCRQIMTGFAEQETYLPSRALYYKRIFVEFFRILPATFAFTTLVLQFTFADLLIQHLSLMSAILLFPVFDFFITLLMTSAAIAVKWILIGRFREDIKPAWSSYVWRSDLIDWLNSLFLDPLILDPLLGTPFISMILRALGAKVGKRVYIDTKLFCEYDLTEIGDDVALNADCLIQTHLFEDRIFKMGPVKIEAGCNVGCGSVVLYNATMEEKSSLGSLSLLMKGETLPANSHWEGIPAQVVSAGAGEPVLIPVPSDVEAMPAWDAFTPKPVPIRKK